MREMIIKNHIDQIIWIVSIFKIPEPAM